MLYIAYMNSVLKTLASHSRLYYNIYIYISFSIILQDNVIEYIMYFNKYP